MVELAIQNERAEIAKAIYLQGPNYKIQNDKDLKFFSRQTAGHENVQLFRTTLSEV